ncbi:MAG: membrane protein [Planctomycetota bacterium]|jgi:membrane protein
MHPLQAALYGAMRVGSLTVRGFLRDRCLFRAQALTFITVLSIVPLLAFTFSVAKGLGAYSRMQLEIIGPFLDNNIGLPAGASADGEGVAAVGLRETLDKLLSFVEDTDFGKIGLFGLAVLLYIVIKLLSSIEASFNDIWGVERPRSIPRKVSDYLSIVVVVPIVLLSATAVTTALKTGATSVQLQETLHIGPVVQELLRMTSLFAAWFGFAFVYLFMPNTRVRLFSAMLGGILGGGLWQLAQILHVQFQFGMSNYGAIYSGIAAFPIFLVWVNISWITVLIGAELAFAHQNEPAYRQIARSAEHDQSFRERVALRALIRLTEVFQSGEGSPEVPDLAVAMGVPERSLEEVLHVLRDEGVLAVDGASPRRYLFARDPDFLRVKEVLDALKGRRNPAVLEAQTETDRTADETLDSFDEQQIACSSNQTIGELAKGGG